MSRPVIGVTVSEIRHKEDVQRVRHGEPTQTEMTLGLSYMRAIEMAAGSIIWGARLPLQLPASSSADHANGWTTSVTYGCTTTFPGPATSS